MMTYEQLLQKTKRLFTDNGLEDAEFQAKQLLFSHYAISSTEYLMQKQRPADSSQAFEEKCGRIISGEPLQYVIGQWDFMGLPFYVGEGVLIPRPETEMLCELALSALQEQESPIVFDLCAGTGCVGIAVAVERPDAKVYLFEKSPKAIAFCKKNIALHKLENVLLLPWDVLQEPYSRCMADAILSNPPYIETEVLSTLQPQVRHEPVMALDGGGDGLKFYRAIREHWLPRLKKGGFLAVEHGDGQSAPIMDLLKKSLSQIETRRDYAGHDRIVTGKK